MHALHFKDVEERIIHEVRKRPEVVKKDPSEIIQAVGMDILENFSLQQIETLEYECRQNPPRLDNLDRLAVCFAAAGLIDCLVSEKRNFMRLENIRCLCEEGRWDLALLSIRSLLLENDFRDEAYHFLIELYQQAGNLDMAALLTRELENPGLKLYQDYVTALKEDLAVFKEYNEVVQIWVEHLNKLSLDQLEDLEKQSRACTERHVLSSEELTNLDQDVDYEENVSYEDLTNWILHPYILSRKQERVSELLKEAKFEDALDMVRSMDKEENFTVEAYAEIVSFLKQKGDDARAGVIANEASKPNQACEPS